MPDFTIYIGNKNYSSWSLRGWLMLKQTGAAFEEVLLPIGAPQSRAEILRYSPSGKVPALRHGGTTVWESLAIGEYLAELFPAARLWPAERRARAVARSISLEMHAGFLALRRHLPMNMRSQFDRAITGEVQADIDRISALWRDSRKCFGAGGDFLFGHFTIADAMYAPVVSRLRTFNIALDAELEAYAASVAAWPAYREWLTAARNEPMIIDQWEL